jgi:mRNA interferase HigB
MRIIAVKTLREFWNAHADAEQPLKAWYKEATESVWKEPNDIKIRYPSADVLPGNRVVFNIKGNTYRLIVKIHYNRSASSSASSAHMRNTTRSMPAPFS